MDCMESLDTHNISKCAYIVYVCINYVPIQKYGDVFDKKPDEKTYLEREIATRLAFWSYTKA